MSPLLSVNDLVSWLERGKYICKVCWKCAHVCSTRLAQHSLWPVLLTWIINNIQYTVWDEITYPFQNFNVLAFHDDVIKWKHFPRNWPFVREIHRSPVNFPHKGQWRGALMFSLIYAWINDWVNNREAGDLRRQHGHYDVIVMWSLSMNT